MPESIRLPSRPHAPPVLGRAFGARTDPPQAFPLGMPLGETSSPGQAGRPPAPFEGLLRGLLRSKTRGTPPKAGFKPMRGPLARPTQGLGAMRAEACCVIHAMVPETGLNWGPISGV